MFLVFSRISPRRRRTEQTSKMAENQANFQPLFAPVLGRMKSFLAKQLVGASKIVSHLQLHGIFPLLVYDSIRFLMDFKLTENN